MDLLKLTPAPWFSHGKQLCQGTVFAATVIATFENEEDAKGSALARNAFDVMMRRGWSSKRHSDQKQWYVDTPTRIPPDGATTRHEHADPFTALVEADLWYVKNVEGK